MKAFFISLFLFVSIKVTSQSKHTIIYEADVIRSSLIQDYTSGKDVVKYDDAVGVDVKIIVDNK